MATLLYVIIINMKLISELNNLTKNPARNDFLAWVIKKTIQQAGYKFLAKKSISISIAIVPKREIKRLNKIYRKKDQVTDILSFAEYKNIAQIKAGADNSGVSGLFLGELVLCYDDISEYAKKKGLALRKELANAVSHGILHLLGMKHGKKMFAIQKNIKR